MVLCHCSLVFVLMQRKPAPDARVLKQRDYEDKLYSMQQGLQVRVTLQTHCCLPSGAAYPGALGCLPCCSLWIHNTLLFCTGAA